MPQRYERDTQYHVFIWPCLSFHIPVVYFSNTFLFKHWIPADLGRNVILTSGCIIGACCQVNTCEAVPENTVVYGSNCIRRVQSEKPQVSSPPTACLCLHVTESLPAFAQICVTGLGGFLFFIFLLFIFSYLFHLFIFYSLRLCSLISSWRFYPTTTTWRRRRRAAGRLWETDMDVYKEPSCNPKHLHMQTPHTFPPLALVLHFSTVFWCLSDYL